MDSRRSWKIYLAVALVAAAAGLMLARMLAQAPVPLAAGTWLPEPRALGTFAARSTRGTNFSNASLRGRPHLLFFGFTYCPDVCPTTLATLRPVLAELPAPLQDLELLFVSIDPERDQLASLGSYVAAFSPKIEALRSDDLPALEPLLHSLGAIATRVELPGGGYTMDHTAALYLLDRQGRYRAVFTAPFSAAQLRADLQRIAAADVL